jgi:DNA repair protein RecN (Recombination protein N)
VGTSKNKNQLLELVVKNLGVIEDASIVFGEGMTAITGETGAGKTLLVTALQLLSGGRSDSSLVGIFGEEATIEGRFICDEDEVILRRIIPKEGRSRAYLNGELSTVGLLQEFTAPIVEIHGQHGYSGLTQRDNQRNALDAFASIDTTQLENYRIEENSLNAILDELGGADGNRGKELELYKFQAAEIDEAEIVDSSEDERLRAEELLLGDVAGNREAAMRVTQVLDSNSRFIDELTDLLREINGRDSLKELEEAVNELLDQASGAASNARGIVESIESDPEKLSQVQQRRSLLTGLRRKYGETLDQVLLYRSDLEQKIQSIEGSDERIKETERLLLKLQDEMAIEEQKIYQQRKKAAPKLSSKILTNLVGLSLPHASIEFSIDGKSGENVELLISLNQGSDMQPLSKVASGGELSRTMLALRLVLSVDPATAIFDEVDAGIGGEVALSVGKALKELSNDRQVLVVTHLAQVAAYANTHIGVTKSETNKRVDVKVATLDEAQRVREISRMLSGSPDSENAQKHAVELIAASRSE